MEKLSQKIIDAILEIDVTKDVPPLGEIVTPILFKNKSLALAINISGRDELLFKSDASNDTIQKSILQLTEIVALLDYLEKNRYILVVETDLINELFYDKTTDFSQTQLPNEYLIADNLNLLSKANEPMQIIEKGKNVIMEGKQVSELLMTPIKRFFSCAVLPTNALKDYKKRGYKALDEYLTRLGLRFSIASMVIAVLIALFSPLATIFLGNRYGISTIKSDQMDSILHTTKVVKIEQDGKKDQKGTDSCSIPSLNICNKHILTNNKSEK